MTRSLLITTAILLSINGAEARPRKHVDSNGNAILVTRETAAGPITVSPEIADKMVGFISDLVERGYKPRRVKCFSLSRSHVPNSLHFRGEACDFDQHGWGLTARAMYHVQDLTAKWGLRNGCSFNDCGHVDSGRVLSARRRVKPDVVVSSYDATMNGALR